MESLELTENQTPSITNNLFVNCEKEDELILEFDSLNNGFLF